MTNVVHVDFVHRTRTTLTCCVCLDPVSERGACNACKSQIAAFQAEHDLRRARMLNDNNKCPGCLRDIDARELLAVIPSKAIALCLACGFGNTP